MPRPRTGSLRRGCLARAIVWNLLASVAFLAAATGRAGTSRYQAGPWPVEVSVVADKPVILLGEPTWLSFVVRNLATEDLLILVGGDYQNELGRPGSFQVKAVRSDGGWVEQPKAGFSTGGLVGPKPLPAGGTYVFRLFVPHWAAFEIPGVYTLSCRRTLQLLRGNVAANFVKTDTIDVLAEAQAKLEVAPPDPAALGRIITDYGETMVRAGGEKDGDDAVLALSWINDPRVVPYFAQALAIRSYAIKFIALHALGKFATDEAFAALQAGMKTRPSDFDPPTGEQAIFRAANIRLAAAHALEQSRHPKARAFLISQRHDEVEAVRLVALQAAGALPDADGRPILEEMSRDSSQQVRNEAKRYLERRPGRK